MLIPNCSKLQAELFIRPGPKGLVDRYWNLAVDTPEGRKTVSINTYKIASIDKDTGKSKPVSGAEEREAVRQAAAKNKLFFKTNSFGRANAGKVAPEDCESILSLAANTKTVKPSGLQAWADKNLGVDCTGFAAAYLASCGIMSLDKYIGGISCPSLLRAAKSNAFLSMDPLCWDLEWVRPGMMILWMNDRGVETKSPGHIAIVQSVDPDETIVTGESSGAQDPLGHRGPNIVRRRWEGVGRYQDGRCINLGKSSKVIFVWPPFLIS